MVKRENKYLEPRTVVMICVQYLRSQISQIIIQCKRLPFESSKAEYKWKNVVEAKNKTIWYHVLG
jgi:hypothetical protein